MMKRFYVWAFSCLLASPVWAAEDAAVTASPWDRHVDLGFIKTSGNTQTTALHGKMRLVHDLGVFRQTVVGSGNSSKDKGVSTSEKYEISGKFDWKRSEIDYMFLHLGFDSDRFSGYKKRTREIVGYGCDFLKQEDLSFSADIGVGFRQSLATDGNRSNSSIVRAAGRYTQKIFTSAEWIEDFATDGGRDGFVSKIDSSLKQSLTEQLSTVFRVVLDHNTKPLAGIKRLDITTSFSIDLAF